MATRKQRRRRAKEQRHDYVWIDDDGNEIDAPEAEESSNGRRESSKASPRAPQAPSWRRTFKRGAIFAPIMLGTVFLLSPSLPLTTKLTQTALIVAVFVPFSYFIDRLFYRSYLRRQARRG